MNERNIELVEITPKDFWGAQDSHLEAIKHHYPKLKFVARGTTMKAYGEEEILDDFHSSSVQSRIDDLHEAFRDDSISLIITTI